MSFTSWILMVFPLVFIIHSMIELFLLKPWLTKNKFLGSVNNSDFTKGTLSIFNKLSGKCLTVIAFEELLIISLATAYALVNNNYYPWIALLCGFFLHLTIHLANWMAYMRYYLSVITTFIAASFCIYALNYIVLEIDIPVIEVIICAFLGSAFSSLNLFLMVRMSLYFKYGKLESETQK